MIQFPRQIKPPPRCEGFMPQSLSAVYIHLVFSTKDRWPYLKDQITRSMLHSYLGGISKTLDCPPITVGGVEDHCHLLARFGRTITQAEWVKELKRTSNFWMKEQDPRYSKFEWQGGYAAFSVSPSNLESVKRYIANQEQRHRKIGFQDELRTLLRKHSLEWMNDTSGIDRIGPQPRWGCGVRWGRLTQGSSPPRRTLEQPWAVSRGLFEAGSWICAGSWSQRRKSRSSGIVSAPTALWLRTQRCDDAVGDQDCS